MLLYEVIITLFVIISHSMGSRNIILIIADDLDIVLDGMTPLNKTATLIGQNGKTFTNCFAAVPVCCPNRASILTGRYQHNHLVVNNSLEGNCNSIQWQNTFENQTFASYLKQDMNYKTFYAGKYLNQYGDPKAGGLRKPLGWDDWYGLKGNSKYYNYILSINGNEKKYNQKPEEYLTDVIKNLATDYIRKWNSVSDSFLMVLAPPAPHEPFTPALRHNDKYKAIRAKRTPNFNTPVQTNKHWLVRRGPGPLPDNVLPELDKTYRKRWETLLALDELVEAVYARLKEKNLLSSTYIIFTSDNGYHIGQFSLPIDKRMPYETDIRVPLLIRGPNILQSEVTSPVSSVDLFATILEIAGINRPSDGTSLLSDNLAIDRTVLIEYKGEKSKVKPASGCPSDSDPNLSLCNKNLACKCLDALNNTYSCIRRMSPNFNNIFCTFEDDEQFIEAYDLATDNYQLKNIGKIMKSALRHRFRKRLNKISKCKDKTCVYTGTQPKYHK
ncbi:N-acetylglucosamine-6-sulfatase-like [Prorops nasuta]|uniref:N-acetylglucosamine-6-sulfatase-like n=1 Tax=Prorops nasuta TaxID=863751 RepID=UPI0034CDBC6E